MIVMTTFFPLFSTYASIYVGHNLGVNRAWAILWIMAVMVLSPHVLANRFMLYVILFWIIVVYLLWNSLWIDLNEWNRYMDRNSFFSIMLSVSLFTYFRISGAYNELAILIKWALIFIAITAIMSVYTATINPMYVRESFLLTKAESFALSKLGGGGYGFSGALVCLFPLIVYYYRRSDNIPFSKPLILLFGVLCLTAVIKIQVFANIIISVFGIIFSLFGSERLRKSLVYLIVFFGLIILIPKNIYSDILITSSRYFTRSQSVNYKLIDMSLFLQSEGKRDETSTGGRLDRYPLLWEGFRSNPITGYYNTGSTLDISPGGHLFWMNKLTTYGIVGFIPFILIFYFHIRLTVKQFDQEFTFYYLLSMFSAILLGFFKTLDGMDFWIMFFFIIPSMYYLPFLKKSTSEIIAQR